jgi:hypothetical protein
MLTAVGTLFGASIVNASAGSAVSAAGMAAYDPDGTANKKLRDALDAAARGHIEAQAKLDASKALEASLNAKMAETKLQLEQLTAQVGEVAAVSYRSGRLGPVSALLESRSPDDFLSRAAGIEAVALYNDSQLHQLRTLRRQLTQQQDRLYAELHLQAEQAALMEKRKKEAERALAAAGGGRTAGGFYVAGTSPAARPAPRNADGSWPKESCTVDDPTTTGCLTPRTYHAYQQTKAAGFNHYVSCFRPSGSGEHPLGRACDWAAATGGFANVNATGADKTYGDRLAAWYVSNANALGVMYVIWYRQCWFPGLGWRSYSGGGDPASDHTNHVHLSMY